ncbi:MAG: hypothetical protein LBP65_01570 [Puniceicoccales bacterium]|jgi:hypothetical protein|nr:hypothetical protein [Puniceicoccales bacterium]
MYELDSPRIEGDVPPVSLEKILERFYGKDVNKSSPMTWFGLGLFFGMNRLKAGLFLMADVLLLVTCTAVLPVGIFIVAWRVVHGEKRWLPLWICISTAVEGLIIKERQKDPLFQSCVQSVETEFLNLSGLNSPHAWVREGTPSAIDQLKSFKKRLFFPQPVTFSAQESEGACLLHDYYVSSSYWNKAVCNAISDTLFNGVTSKNFESFDFHQVLEKCVYAREGFKPESVCNGSVILRDVTRGLFEVEGESKASLENDHSTANWVNAFGRAAWRKGGAKALCGAMRILCSFGHIQGGAMAMLLACKNQLVQQWNACGEDGQELWDLFFSCICNCKFVVKMTLSRDGSIIFYSKAFSDFDQENDSFEGLDQRIKDAKSEVSKDFKVDKESLFYWAEVQFTVSPQGDFSVQTGKCLVRFSAVQVQERAATALPGKRGKGRGLSKRPSSSNE